MVNKKNKKFLIFIFIMIIITILYTVGIRPYLKNTSTIVNLELCFTGVVLLILVLFLLTLIVTAFITLLLYIFFKKGQPFAPWILRLMFLVKCTTTLALIFFIIAMISQKICFTPSIFNSNGNELKGSIVELKQIDIRFGLNIQDMIPEEMNQINL